MLATSAKSGEDGRTMNQSRQNRRRLFLRAGLGVFFGTPWLASVAFGRKRQ